MDGDESGPVTLTVTLSAHVAEALDAWIARSTEPTLTRDEAAGHVLAGARGPDTPGPLIPGLVTGRDIV